MKVIFPKLSMANSILPSEPLLNSPKDWKFIQRNCWISKLEIEIENLVVVHFETGREAGKFDLNDFSYRLPGKGKMKLYHY